jgi:hypothetical protein
MSINTRCDSASGKGEAMSINTHTADAFASELILLWRDHNYLSSRKGLKSGTPEWPPRETQQDAVYGHIKAVEAAASYASIEGPSGIILLLGLIDNAASALESLAPASSPNGEAEALRDAIGRMAYTAVRWVEFTHRIDRTAGAGDVYLPANCDPLDSRYTAPREVA